MSDDNSATAGSIGPKRIYHRPKLTRYGDIKSLTRGPGTRGAPDSNPAIPGINRQRS